MPSSGGLEDKKVLVLGGARFHGYLLVQKLLENRAKVTVLNRGNFRKDYPAGVEHLKVDRKVTSDLNAALSGRKFDIVFDNSAYNAADVKSLAEVLDIGDAKYIIISSVAVYLKHSSNAPLSEEDLQLSPDSLFDSKIVPYALGKREAELAAHSSFSGAASVVRFPNIFGKGDFLKKLTYFKKKLTAGHPILLEQEIEKFSYICVEDAVDILIGVALSAKSGGCTVNAASPRFLSYEEFFRRCFGSILKDSLIKRVSTAEVRKSGEVLPFAWSPIVNLTKLKSIYMFKETPIETWAAEGIVWEEGKLTA